MIDHNKDENEVGMEFSFPRLIVFARPLHLPRLLDHSFSVDGVRKEKEWLTADKKLILNHSVRITPFTYSLWHKIPSRIRQAKSHIHFINTVFGFTFKIIPKKR